METRERKIFYPRFLFLNALLLVFVVATFPGKTAPVDYFYFYRQTISYGDFFCLGRPHAFCEI